MALRALLARRTCHNVGLGPSSLRLGVGRNLQWRRLKSTAASSVASAPEPPRFVEKEGWLFVDSIFPVQLGTWECVPLFLFGLNDGTTDGLCLYVWCVGVWV